MFEQLYKLAQNASELNVNDIAYSCYFYPEIQQIIIRRNTSGQLAEGVDSSGVIVGVYSAWTELISKGERFTWDGKTYEKIGGEPYNFIDTGEFFESFDVIIDDDGFSIFANDEKPNGTKLTKKYGPGILGLTDESITELARALIPIFQEETRKALAK